MVSVSKVEGFCFDYAQEVSNAKLHPRKKSHFFPLRGFITCVSCGCMFTATNKKGHDYYYCTNGKGICTAHKKYLRETSLYGEVSKILETTLTISTALSQNRLYFNEILPYPAQWLRNLWPGNVVDEQSIVDVQGANLLEYDRVHFFLKLFNKVFTQ